MVPFETVLLSEVTEELIKQDYAYAISQARLKPSLEGVEKEKKQPNPNLIEAEEEEKVPGDFDKSTFHRSQSNLLQPGEGLELFKDYDVDAILQKFKSSKSYSQSPDVGDWENVDAVDADELDLLMVGGPPFKELWEDIELKHREKQELQYQSYKLKPIIAKENDDLRQELMAMQLMKRFLAILKESGMSIFLRPYDIVVTSHNAGFIEFITDTISIDQLKKRFPKDSGWTLRTFYEKKYGTLYFEEAQKNFVESLAGYSLFNYLFAVKDRHNGNILIDSAGHLVHIDFGFMF